MLHRFILYLVVFLLAGPALTACGSDEVPAEDQGDGEVDPGNDADPDPDPECTSDAEAPNCEVGYSCLEQECVLDAECTLSSHCDPGHSCIDLECVENPACTDGSECGDGFSCVNQECHPDPDCTSNEQCDEGHSCINEECVENPGCTSSSQCDTGSSCVDQECVENPECSLNSHCDSGFSCVDQGCVPNPECTTSEDCEDDYSCIDLECVPDPECAIGTDCGDGFSCLNQECVADPECSLNSDCDDGFSCVNQICEANPECTLDAQCDANYSCVDQICVEDPPECVENDDCGQDASCIEDECVPDDVVDPVTTDQELCEDYCGLLYLCIESECSDIDTDITDALYNECVSGDPNDASFNGCMGDLEGLDADADREYYLEFVYGDEEGNLTDTKNTCEVTEPFRCGEQGIHDFCNCTPPSNLGGACDGDAACDEGSLEFAQCLEGETLPGGYCVAGFCYSWIYDDGSVASLSADGGCGAGEGCVDAGDFGYCLDLCDSHTECRDGYSCQVVDLLVDLVSDGQGGSELAYVDISRSCDAPCEGPTDCGDAARCNLDTGACELSCEDQDGIDACGFVNGECTDINGTEWCVMD